MADMDNGRRPLLLTRGACWRLLTYALATLVLLEVAGTDLGSFLAALALFGAALLKGLPLSEGAFLGLCFGMVVGRKDFAYLHVQMGTTPLYIAELALGLITLALFMRNFAGGGFPVRLRWIDSALLLFWVAGIYAALRGREAPLLALRDFAIVYYSVFFGLARAIFHDLPQIYRLLRVLLVGSMVAAGEAFFNYALQREIDIGRFMSSFAGAFIVVTLLVLLVFWRTLPNKIVWFGILWFLAASLVLTQMRSIVLTVVTAVVFMALLGRRERLVGWTPILVTLSVSLLGASIYTLAGLSSEFLAKTTERLYSGFFKFGSDPTVNFRFDAWNEAWSRFARDPLQGEGFGIPFIFFNGMAGGYVMRDVRPHNTFLTVLYKMGLVGFLPFLATLVAFYVFLIRAYRAAKEEKPCLLSLGAAHIALLALGSFNLLLESPYQSFLFWTLMGLAYAAEPRRPLTPAA